MKKNILIFHLYPFRPHVDYSKFLVDNLKDKHNVIVLRCFNNFSNCYYKSLKGNNLKTCIQCNLYSNPFNDTYLPNKKVEHVKDNRESIVSSIATAKRLESTQQIKKHFKNHSAEIDKYNLDLNKAFQTFLSIIKKKEVDFVWGFNGRMDHTKMFFKACKAENIPFISFEYPWFGNGINLIANEDCLSLKVYHYVNKKFSKHPLTYLQCQLAFKYASRRFNKQMGTEWRDYSSFKIQKSKQNIKALILPSSRSEFEGHNDYKCEWGHSTNGFRRVLEELDIDSSHVYIQFHPIWFQKVNGVSGKNPINYYTNWVKDMGYNAISSSETFESKDLISRSDLILINGSSAALEAGLMGKKIINVDKNKFTYSGVTIDVYKPESLSTLKQKINAHDVNTVKRATLRFFYSLMGRVNSFEREILATTSTKVKFAEKDFLPVLEDYMKTSINKKLIINDKTIGLKTEPIEDEFIADLFKKNRTNQYKWKKYNKILGVFRSLIAKGDK